MSTGPWCAAPERSGADTLTRYVMEDGPNRAGRTVFSARRAPMPANGPLAWPQHRSEEHGVAEELLEAAEEILGDQAEAATERSEREQVSVAFEGMPDHQLAVGGPGSDSSGGTDAADHFWGLDAGDRLGGGPEGDVLRVCTRNELALEGRSGM